MRSGVSETALCNSLRDDRQYDAPEGL